MNKKQGKKLQAFRQHKKNQIIKPEGKELRLVQPYPGKGSKSCGARHPGRVWACERVREWDGDGCCSSSQLLLGSAVPHVWLHPAIQEQPSLSRALAQAKWATEPQLYCCSQKSAARGKCLLCLCLEEVLEENVTHTVNARYCVWESSSARSSALGAAGGISIVRHTTLLL